VVEEAVDGAALVCGRVVGEWRLRCPRLVADGHAAAGDGGFLSAGFEGHGVDGVGRVTADVGEVGVEAVQQVGELPGVAAR
jgi:hypothetical protein